MRLNRILRRLERLEQQSAATNRLGFPWELFALETDEEIEQALARLSPQQVAAFKTFVDEPVPTDTMEQRIAAVIETYNSRKEM